MHVGFPPLFKVFPLAATTVQPNPAAMLNVTVIVEPRRSPAAGLTESPNSDTFAGGGESGEEQPNRSAHVAPGVTNVMLRKSTWNRWHPAGADAAAAGLDKLSMIIGAVQAPAPATTEALIMVRRSMPRRPGFCSAAPSVCDTRPIISCSAGEGRPIDRSRSL
jgi:hypothetical protein